MASNKTKIPSESSLFVEVWQDKDFIPEASTTEATEILNGTFSDPRRSRTSDAQRTQGCSKATQSQVHSQERPSSSPNAEFVFSS
jgi:hypothetical protein